MKKLDELRPHDTVRSQLRIPAELHERLKVVCNATGRSMNAEIVRRLEDSFDGRVRVELPAQLLTELEEEAARHSSSVDWIIRQRVEESKARERSAAPRWSHSIAVLAQKRAEQLSLLASIDDEIQRVKALAGSESDAPGEEPISNQLEMLNEIRSAIRNEERRTAMMIARNVNALKKDRKSAFTDSVPLVARESSPDDGG